MIPLTSTQPFEQQIEREFCQGSAISRDLFKATVELVNDTEALSGGEVRYPIHEALNWNVSRFGHQARESLQAAIFLNEDGYPWQVKLSKPRFNQKKGKKQKYEYRRGGEVRAFLPKVPLSIRRKIAKRYGITDPSFAPNRHHRKRGIKLAPFWEWIEQHPEIPIIWTEGGKKALCLLSLGYVAIALTGINGGYRSKDTLGIPCSPYLIPDVARFAQPERQHTLAFDQDIQQATRYRVERALCRFGRLLEASGGTVKVTTWKPDQGKGVDDLIVQGGSAAWESAYSEALPLQHWQIWQRLDNRLTWKPSLKVKTHDLSTLDISQLPQSGIVAIFAPKATGKTKLTVRMVQGQDKVLSLAHRIALCRNTCERLGLSYRGDLDKTPDGRFITGSAYTLRVGACVDALLAINPQHFDGCDLVIDEAVQVVQHLLTSSTCAQDGKRPALLARFHDLIRIARRVILADADLDNNTLGYFKDLRGDSAPVFLIRNDYQTKPYPVRFIQAKGHEAVISDLMDDLHRLEPGKTLFVATDNKGVTKKITRLIANSFQGKRVLVINSDTSGSEAEREFIQNPDKVLERGDYDLIIVSPSLGTGVSIECQGIISKVYGIFTGVSSNDADISQALIRVREPVERVVWVAKRGRNYSKVGRSTNPLALKTALMEQTSVSVSLIRSGLKEDTIALVQNYDWQSDPHLNLYCKLAAAQNFSMLHLRDAVLVRLRYEGQQVTIEDREYDPAVWFLYRQAATEQKRTDAELLVKADIVNYAQVEALKQKESRSPEEEQAIARFHLCDFYGMAPNTLAPEFALWDDGGRRRGEVLNLEALLYPGAVIDATVRGLEKQASWNQSLCPWDIPGTALRAEIWKLLGLADFIDPNREWTAADCKAVADLARQHWKQVQSVLHFTASPKMSDVQIVHQLLSQLGLKVIFRWKGTYGKGKHKVYRLDPVHWQSLAEILERRQERRVRLAEYSTSKGSPLPLDNKKQTGDPSLEPPEELEQWLSPESMADVRLMWARANTPDLREAVRQLVPPEVLERAIA